MGLEKINAPRVGLSAPQLLPAPPRPHEHGSIHCLDNAISRISFD